MPLFFECRKGGEILIGRDFSCTSRLFISCLGKIVIGDDCLLGNNVRIYDSNHGRNPELSYRYQDSEILPVTIKGGYGLAIM